MDLYAYIQKDEELINKYIDEHYDGQNIPRYRGDLLDVKWDIIKEADRKAQDLRYTMTYSFIVPTHRLTIYLRRREQRRIKIEFDCQALMLRPPLHGLEEEVNNRIAKALNTRGDK